MTQQPTGRQNGAAIRAFRKKEKMSVVELAGYIGLHPQSLRNVENGRRPASDEIIRHLSRVLGVPVDAITRAGPEGGASDGAAEDEAAQAAPAEPAGAAA